MQLDENREQLVAILQERPNEFWLAYTVWLRLNERFPAHAAQLAAEYGGHDAVGEGGEVHYGPVSHIARSLAAAGDHIDVAYLNTTGLTVSGIKASGDRLGIFRLRTATEPCREGNQS